MRIFSTFFKWLCAGAMALALPFLCHASDKPENVVLQYHFVGATQMADNTNAAAAQKVFALLPTTNYETLVLGRLTVKLEESLSLPINKESFSSLLPLVVDLLHVESIVSMGGSPGKPLSYVLAVHLGAERLAAWQKDFKAAMGDGEEFRAEKFSGWQWHKGASNAFWIVPAGDWMVLGKGGELNSVRSDYLKQIRQNGRPAPGLDSDWFEADVDWPRLANWIPLDSCPLKLGRTQIAISAESGGFYMTSHVTYPEAIQWQPHAMSVPTNMVRQPLLSFCTGKNVAPFMNENLSRFCTDPFRDQFYFWSMRELAFQSYLAWPVSDPAGTLATLAEQVSEDLNPKLKGFDGTFLKWVPETLQFVWKGLPLIVPQIVSAPPEDGSFLVASLFPLTHGEGPAPAQLWGQFEGRSDLIYYDWELTGMRVRHLLTVTQVVPIVRALGIGPQRGVKHPKVEEGAALKTRLDIEEQWLTALGPLLDNTVTEAAKTGPNEVTILRHSPFVFSSLELVLLSHWLTDTPSGPLDWSLLPQAKMSRGGMPPPPPAAKH